VGPLLGLRMARKEAVGLAALWKEMLARVNRGKGRCEREKGGKRTRRFAIPASSSPSMSTCGEMRVRERQQG
jgi:hypothetical protein